MPTCTLGPPRVICHQEYDVAIGGHLLKSRGIFPWARCQKSISNWKKNKNALSSYKRKRRRSGKRGAPDQIACCEGRSREEEDRKMKPFGVFSFQRTEKAQKIPYPKDEESVKRLFSHFHIRAKKEKTNYSMTVRCMLSPPQFMCGINRKHSCSRFEQVGTCRMQFSRWG